MLFLVSDLSFIKSNMQDGESATSATYSNLVVLKFIKQGLTDSIYETENKIDYKLN